MTRTKQVTVRESHYQNLQAKAKELEEANQELRDIRKELSSLRKEMQEKTQDPDYDNAFAEKEDEISRLADENAALKERLTKVSANLRKTGKVPQEDLNDKLVVIVENIAKTSIFRTYKFLEDDSDLLSATRATIDYLPNTLETLKLTEEEFIMNYKGVVKTGIKIGRQYVQSEGRKRAKGTLGLCIC